MSIIAESHDPDTGLVILQSLLCLMREKNLLTRADIEDLSARVKMRMADREGDPMACCNGSEASTVAANLSNYIGTRYGGKHLRP